MSDLSVILNDIEKFFKGLSVSNTPAVSAASSAVSQAATAIVNAVPTIADAAANAVLALIPGGTAYTVLADSIINETIAILEGKLSTASSAVPKPIVVVPPATAVQAGVLTNLPQ